MYASARTRSHGKHVHTITPNTSAAAVTQFSYIKCLSSTDISTPRLVSTAGTNIYIYFIGKDDCRFLISARQKKTRLLLRLCFDYPYDRERDIPGHDKQ